MRIDTDCKVKAGGIRGVLSSRMNRHKIDWQMVASRTIVDFGHSQLMIEVHTPNPNRLGGINNEH
jgi:hypothetical protein